MACQESQNEKRPSLRCAVAAEHLRGEARHPGPDRRDLLRGMPGSHNKTRQPPKPNKALLVAWTREKA
jgi:hypothetical protein